MTVAVNCNARIIGGIPRFGDLDNYSGSFGFQWNKFDRTQLHRHSSEMFWHLTGWTPAELVGIDLLEAGAGAGRLSRVILQETEANLYALDYSSAVEANMRSNGSIAPERFHLCQASIYDMPYPDESFDKVLCRGVLQHTPDFAQSVRALVSKAKHGGQIVVDFYEIRGWWTKVNAKYMLRPFTRRMSNDRLLGLIDRNLDWMMAVHDTLVKTPLRHLTRFLPLVDIAGTFPPDLTPAERREWALLDTFDMFSPEFDNPQRTRSVVRMFEQAGCEVTFSAPGIVRAFRR
ncbi:class I SAM-dependent methyltransferase [Porphyrobacter sp. ULC335]|uniref:class I SAM-dependent methyltransferase n=1 Tax=Porphyrobacter sp. ULC335 TaxID=2854260 RepID=UPI0022206ED5|nr:class I SAM-dependent methyltransferase [Porphyrobacter sp. ULC335]UYV16902.1 class I SAM-dependent methyltransferase [Porphyrobacter sp. ULC335]